MFKIVLQNAVQRTLVPDDDVIQTLAGFSCPFVALDDSVSSLPASRASPVSTEEKSSSSWIFCCSSSLRLMAYLPLLSFGPSATVPGSAYPLTPLSVPECLTNLADVMTHYALC